MLSRGKDARFDEIRQNFWYFLGFWVWQILWVYVVSASFLFINAQAVAAAGTPLGGWDWAGWALFVLGFGLQARADLVKNAFRADPANAKKVCDVGPWRWSRHPNFAGEVYMWWGLFLAGVPVFVTDKAGWLTVASPLFTMLVLVGFSGIPTAEGANAKRW